MKYFVIQKIGWVEIKKFIKHQVETISDGGSPIFLRKLKRIICFILLIPTAIFVILLIRIIRPIILVRFGPLISFRIGHYAANTEIYLCKREAGMERPKVVDFFFHLPVICNEQLKKMWDRSSLNICSFTEWLYYANQILPGGKKHVLDLRESCDYDTSNLIPQFQPHITFTECEESAGRESLRNMGILDGSPFVCIYSRDKAYLNNEPNHPRNANIQNFIEAVQALARRGCYSLRMGAVVEKSLFSNNPKVIDYATKYRSDFLDIYLCSKCNFFIGGSGGLTSVPLIFRKPRVLVNAIPYEGGHSFPAYDLFIFKKMWLKENRKFMTFSKIINSGLSKCCNAEKFEQLGIELVENTPEEIKAVVIEMDERLKGTWQTTEEDEEMQNRFWNMFPNDLWPKNALKSRIGTEFLRQNKDLLE